MVVLITYQFLDKAPDAQGLETAIKSYGTWWHHLNKVWLIETKESCAEVYNKLTPFFNEEDRLLVVQIGADYAGWLNKEAWVWLQDVKKE